MVLLLLLLYIWLVGKELLDVDDKAAANDGEEEGLVFSFETSTLLLLLLFEDDEDVEDEDDDEDVEPFDGDGGGSIWLCWYNEFDCEFSVEFVEPVKSRVGGLLSICVLLLGPFILKSLDNDLLQSILSGSLEVLSFLVFDLVVVSFLGVLLFVSFLGVVDFVSSIFLLVFLFGVFLLIDDMDNDWSWSVGLNNRSDLFVCSFSNFKSLLVEFESSESLCWSFRSWNNFDVCVDDVGDDNEEI